MGDTCLSPERRLEAERAARDALVHMGFEVAPDPEGVKVTGAG